MFKNIQIGHIFLDFLKNYKSKVGLKYNAPTNAKLLLFHQSQDSTVTYFILMQIA